MKSSRDLSLFKLGDLICIVAVLLLSIVLSLSAQVMYADSDEPILEINADGEISFYDLSEERTVQISSNGVSLTVRISEGYAWIETSDCPDGVCRTMGRISKNGQSAICAPAKVAITVRSATDEEVPDAIVR